MPIWVDFGGATMDVECLATNSESKTNCGDVWSDFNRIQILIADVGIV
jgi:hypothetical protein